VTLVSLGPAERVTQAGRSYPDQVTSVPLGLPRTRRAQPDQSGSARSGGSTRPSDHRLLDSFGRVATDLRVSLTDKCSLRCSYCMPPEGLDWMPTDQALSDAEVIRLITIAVDRLGVEEVRFTGGEPLLRRGLEKIVEATAGLRTATGSAPVTALTTNGIGLAKRAAGLRSAGLNRVNVSLDTLDRARFRQITHRDRLDDVLAGLAAADAAELGPVKVNTVLLPGVNDDEPVGLLGWAIEHGYELRFIEQMPLDAQGAWERSTMITADQILTSLSSAFELTPTDPARRGAAPAQTWFVGPAATNPTANNPAASHPDVATANRVEQDHVDPARRRPTVGIIASVSRPFCGDCDRTRLTADGQIRDCLFAAGETDLRDLLRGGADDDQLADVWRTAMWAKKPGHGINDPAFLQPDRPMSAIGG
jgi:cyclic pyranopterin phosphate synthase